MTGLQQLSLTLQLAVPAILAQFSSVMMQYIDSAMVGHLGSNQAAAIGLVSSSSWILYGFAMAATTGFSVQVAHKCGASDFKGARSVMRQGLLSVFLFSTLIALTGVAISGPLPFWLGGGEDIAADAGTYFWIFSAFMPISATGFAASAMLQTSGNMKVPSILYISMCALDVLFNYVFIYALDMGVAGAALGTGVAETLTSLFTLWFVFTRSKELRIVGERGSFLPRREILSKALGITAPLWLQNIIMRGAYVMGTVIVAPLGSISIAANAFAIAAESFCYMPGYGLQDAATTLVGQSIGARRKDEARHFAWITIWMAAGMMTLLGILMYIFAPQMMGVLTDDPQVIELGVRVLRIEAFAEFFYAVSIAAFGVCAGAGDTLVPSVLEFSSMWVIRIGLALVLTPRYGLVGYWISMMIELNVRGIILLLYVKGGRSLRKSIA